MTTSLEVRSFSKQPESNRSLSATLSVRLVAAGAHHAVLTRQPSSIMRSNADYLMVSYLQVIREEGNDLKVDTLLSKSGLIDGGLSCMSCWQHEPR